MFRTAGMVHELIRDLFDLIQILSICFYLLMIHVHPSERLHKPALLEWSALSRQVKLAAMNCKCCFHSFFNEIHWVPRPEIFLLPSTNETFHQDYTLITTASLLFFCYCATRETHIEPAVSWCLAMNMTKIECKPCYYDLIIILHY